MRLRPALFTLAAAAVLTACAPGPIEGTPSADTPVASPAVSEPAAHPTPTPETEPTPATTAPQSCTDVAADLDLVTRVGQLYMVGVSTGGLDPATSEAISATRVGSVVLLGNSTAGAAAVAEITDAVAELADGIPVAIAVDQEGGTVQRLRGTGFSDIPPAVEQAQLPDGELRDRAQQWAGELADVGVHVNLAPVADVVPAAKQESNAPIGVLRRNYGNDATATSRSVTEFVEGMASGGVATSLKHFPGLGQVVENTDFDVAVDTDVSPGDEDWAPFIAGIDAGAESVMISSGIFENIDPGVQAVFSTAVITETLRNQLGFDGIVIADDLGAAVAVADIPPADRGVRFIEAGGDVVINADPALLVDMVGATLTRAGEDTAFEAQVTAAAGRVLDLKASLGLVDCAPAG